MGFGDAVRSAFNKYATFEGRAARSEYWWFGLFIVIVSVVLSYIDMGILHTTYAMGTSQAGILSGIFSLAMLLPALGVAVRRLHDVDRSGWWLLIGLTGIGGLVLLYWYVTRGTVGPNSYGPDPLG